VSEEEDGLYHYGIKRKSGRYPWGSGKDEYQRSRDFKGLIADLKKRGLSQTEIVKALDIKPDEEGNAFSLTNLRDTTTVAQEVIIREQTFRARQLKEKQWSIKAIAEELDIPEPTVRSRLKESETEKKKTLEATADFVREQVNSKKIVDIGKGNEHELGISPERMRAAISILKDEGYKTHVIQQPQPGSRHKTNQLVMVEPGVSWAQAMKMKGEVQSLGGYTLDNGITWQNIHPPLSISSKRLAIKYAEEGGTERDGVVYVRPGVADLAMGKNKYAQVRIAIDGTHFIKGMAIQSDDIPAGHDLLFHTNKSVEKGKMGVLKPMKTVSKTDDTIDQDNPFGSTIKKQITTIDPATGKRKVTSAINLVYEEGDWDTWGNSLPSQMLSKQPHTLIKSQLDHTLKVKQEQIDRINSITNPVLRKKQLEKLADQIDSEAVDLRAAAMSDRQRTQVIIPIPKMSPQEVYAPNFKTGESVVLIRYPHAGRFEIPELVVNNNNRTAKALLGNAADAVGIHPKVAARLSGADFDGDTVVVIPNPTGKIKGANSLGRSTQEFDKALANFDTKAEYGGFIQSGVDAKGDKVGNFKLMKNTGQQMGMITNLITDMSAQGAKTGHMIRAVKHSMVVIDAEKHELDYKRSEQQNGISQLAKIYQGKDRPGATTLLSLATSQEYINERKARPAALGGAVDKVTGERMYVDTGKSNNKFDKKTGTYIKDEKVMKQERAAKLSLTTDAHTLVSKNASPVELMYADFANSMKGLANKTRLQSLNVPRPKTDPRAKKEYAAEVDSLVSKLREAERQKPMDRQAQVIANQIIRQKRQEDPSLRYDQDRMKKVERQTRDGVRARMGLKKTDFEITDREWDAIQAGAVSADRFKKILDTGRVPEKRLFELALPQAKPTMTLAMTARAKSMANAGMTTADIALALGVSPSTIKGALKPKDQ
jgi:predicted transcriptional regulator